MWNYTSTPPHANLKLVNAKVSLYLLIQNIIQLQFLYNKENKNIFILLYLYRAMLANK
jgi:hypothetical protein